MTAGNGVQGHSRSSPATVLVVDDEQDLCEVIAFDIALAGFNTLCAYNGNDALELLKTSPVDVVLTDIRMPGCDGIKLLETIKAKGVESPAVLFMSAFSDISLEDALDKGAERVFSKPFEPQSLFEALESILLPSGERWARPVAGDTTALLERRFASLAGALQTGELKLGRGGMFLALSSPPNPAANVRFRLEFEDDSAPIAGTGEVRWSRNTVRRGLPAGAGVEFTYLEKCSRQALSQWLRAHPVRHFIPKS